jgi:hypothetical protein
MFGIFGTFVHRLAANWLITKLLLQWELLWILRVHEAVREMEDCNPESAYGQMK